MSNTNSSSVTIEYEYQLEVFYNAATTSFNARNNNFMPSLQQVLTSRVDQNLLATLQSMLPNGGGGAEDITASFVMEPNVRFAAVNSNIYSACFTNSDECGLVRTLIVMEYDGDDKPDHSLERVGYQLVQDYLNDLMAPATSSEQQQQQQQQDVQLRTRYLYPYWVSSKAQFQLSPVTERMSQRDIDIVEISFLQVVGATVGAMEGDTEVVDVQFLYQDLLVLDGDGEEVETNSMMTIVSKTVVQADFTIHGTCRECRDVEFASLLDAIISRQLPALQARIQRNAQQQSDSSSTTTTYFDLLTAVEYAVPDLPASMPLAEDETHTNSSSGASSYLPVYFFFALFGMICILASGVFVIWKETQYDDDEEEDEDEDDYEYDDDYKQDGFGKEQDAFSTASESPDDSSQSHSNGHIQRSPQRRRRKPLEPVAVQEYHVEDEAATTTTTAAASPPDTNLDRMSLREYQVETVLSNDMVLEEQEADVHPPSYTSATAGSGRRFRGFSQSRYQNHRTATVSPATGLPYYHNDASQHWG